MKIIQLMGVFCFIQEIIVGFKFMINKTETRIISKEALQILSNVNEKKILLKRIDFYKKNGYWE